MQLFLYASILIYSSIDLYVYVTMSAPKYWSQMMMYIHACFFIPTCYYSPFRSSHPIPHFPPVSLAHPSTFSLSLSPSVTVSFKTILYFRSLYYSNNIPRPYFWTYSRLTLTAFKMKNPTYCHNETTHECSLLQLGIGNISLIINHSLTLSYTIVVELLISLMWQALFSFVCLRLKLY